MRARKLAPDDVDTLMHFGAVCLRRDLAADALEALEQAHRLAPGDNGALYLAARANIAVQKWQRAYDLFSEYAERVPTFPATYYAMGWLDRKLNRVPEARRQLEHCLSLASNYADARCELAQLELDDGHIDSAEKLLKQVLEEDPGHIAAKLAMSDIMMRRGSVDQAQDLLEKAVKEDPQNSAAHYKLSQVFFRRHMIDQGKAEAKLAASLTSAARNASRMELRLILPEESTK